MMRAERSRHAAKMRRDKETEEITALSKLLPYPEEVTRRLDKGSIIRLTTSYLRMKKFSQKEGTALLDELKKKAITSGAEKAPEEPQVNEGALMLQALNGFILFISRKGGILYASENVGKQLGIHQYDMIGNSIIDFIHPDDQKELAKQFVVQFPGHQTFKGYGMENPDDSPTAMNVNFFDDTTGKEESPTVADYIQDRHFFLRMKSVVSRRSIGGKGKVVGYRVVNFSGRLKLKGSTNSKGYSVEGLICLCRPIQPQPILEIRMDGNMFMSRHGLDMSFTFCDPRIITLVGYEPHEVIGKTAYQFHNPLDARKVSDCHSKLIVKGSSMSKYYRFLGKQGEWVWMQTKATIIYNTNNVAQYVVCMNYVIGKDEGERHLLMEQMQRSFDVAMSDSDSCGSPSTPGTPSTSGIGSCSDSDDLGSPKIIELKEEDLAQLVPQAVRENQEILKPKDECGEVSFKNLCKSTKCDEDVPMEVCTKEEANGETTNTYSESDAISAATVCSTSVIPKQEAKVDQLQKSVSSPLDKVESPASDVESLTSSTSGSICSPPSQEQEQEKEQVGNMGEEEEQVWMDILGIANGKDFPANMDSEFPRMSFSVASPDNLSQILNSPGTTRSLCTDVPSPSMSWLDDDVFNGDKLNSPANNILLNLLNEPLQTEKLQKQDNSSNQTLKQMLSSAVITESSSRTGSCLPADLADFSLEYASKSLDQAVNGDATTIRDCSLDQTLQGQCGLSESADRLIITEITDTQPIAVTTVMTASSTVTLSPAASVAQPTAISQYSDINAAAAPTLTAAVCNGQSIPPASNGTQAQTFTCDSRVVTEGMSKLDIQDLVASQNQGTLPSMLKALLTGAEKNPLATHIDNHAQLRLPSSNGLESVADLLGPITPSTKAAVETLDSLMQDHLTSSRDIPINNNRMNHEDLTLLQRQEQEKQLLEQQFNRQRQILQENHVRQQRMMEEHHRRQLIQRHTLQQQLQQQVALSKQLQLKLSNNGIPPNGLHNGMPQNGMPQKGVPQNATMLAPTENGIDMTGMSDLDFQPHMSAAINIPQQQQQQQFPTNGTFSPPQSYQLTPQQNGFPRQPAPYQQGSPPVNQQLPSAISLPHTTQQSNVNFPLQSSQNSLLAACLSGPSALAQQSQPQPQPQHQPQHQQQPIQQSLPPSFHPSSTPPTFSSNMHQSTHDSCTSNAMPPPDWQMDHYVPSMGPAGRRYVNGQTSPITDINNFQEACLLQQPLQF